MSGRCPLSRDWFLPLMFLVVFLVIPGPGPSLAQCPANTVYCSGNDCCPGDVIFNEHETSAEPALGVSFGNSSASYNLVSGTLTAVADVAEAWEHKSGATAVDVFTVTGVAAAAITVRLELTWVTVVDPGGKTSWTSGYARLEADGQSTETYSYGPNIDPYIEIAIDVTGGQPFTVTYETIAAGWAQFPMASMTARLVILDLPEGAGIASCNGYDPTVVPVEHATWGRIKSLFR
jgi:hypothetical protein